ncbi:MAG: Gfo/Idh/MocA family protein [Planctomycetota bacterium]
MTNVGIIGCGYWGPNLVRNFMSLGDCHVAMVCDIDEERLKYIHRTWPDVKTTDDYRMIVDDTEIDAVVIATPVRLHYPMASRSLSAGKHTFVEKPMADSVSDAAHLVELAEQNHLTLMVGHTFIYSAPVRWIARVVAKGVLGEIQYISSRRLNLGLFQKDINVAWDLAPHDLSIILYVMKCAVPTSVCCSGKAHVTEGIEDVTSMSLDFSNGAFATIQSSWLDPNKTREMTFVGSRKMLVYNDIANNEKIKIYDKHVEVPRHYDTFGEFHYSYHYGDMRSPYLKQTEPLKVECEHFLDSVRTGAVSESDGREGLLVVRILEAASESLRTGGRKIPLGPALAPTSPPRIKRPSRGQLVQTGESHLGLLSPARATTVRNASSTSSVSVLSVSRARGSEQNDDVKVM